MTMPRKNLAVLIGGVLLCGAWPLPAQDPVQVSPDFKVEIENQWVRVLRSRFAPHASHGMHQHPNTVLVFLTDADIQVTNADGTMRELHQKAGDVTYIDSARHSEVNLSEKPVEVVLVELKPERLKPPKITLDPVKLDPEHHTVPLENDRVRVLRTVLEPHIKSPVHEHPSYVVVYLTELHTTMKLADGRMVDNPRKPGDIAWRDAYSHQTENIGEKTAVEIQVELK
jgi:quercetin dioxygenase-like cupin family protein